MEPLMPEPPKQPKFLDVPDGLGVQERHGLRGVVTVFLVVAVLGGLAALTFSWLRPGPQAETKTVSAPSPTPQPAVNPCAEDTFDANACAVRMIEGATKQTGVPPYTVVKIWCAKYATPKAQREIVDRWLKQGAPSREMARAVLDEILAYCPGLEKT